MSASQTLTSTLILVKIFGQRQPGITAGLFGQNNPRRLIPSDVVDIEQVVRVPNGAVALLTPPDPTESKGICGPTVHSWAESVSMQAEIMLQASAQTGTARTGAFTRDRARPSAHRGGTTSGDRARITRRADAT